MPGSQFTDRSDGIVQAGKLRRKLTIQTATNTSDGAGGYTTTWSTLVTVFGALNPWRPKEYFYGQQVEETVYVRYIIRYMPSTQITSGMRLVDNDSTGTGGVTYTILSALDFDGTKRQLHLSCQQVAPGT